MLFRSKTPKKDSPAEDALPVAGQETQDYFSDENMDIDETQIPQENAEGGENSDEDEFDYSDFELEDETCSVRTICTVRTTGKTGVEMEALTGVQIALLTIYDMCKAVDKGMEMNGIHLCQKSGGKSGIYIIKAKQEV